MTMARPKAKTEALPVRFSWNAWPRPGDRVALGQRLARRPARPRAIASPELTPGLPLPSTLRGEEAVEALELLGADDVR